MDKADKLLVSIIVVAYQSDKFILDTLDSIKLQTWDKIELIITDDGSTDQTLQMSRSWISKNKNRFVDIKLISVAKNTGIPSNCDRGFNASKGDWIKFIGADDILLPDCIRDNMNCFNQNPDVSLIISDLIEINFNGKIIRVSPQNEGLNYFMRNQKSKNKKLKAYARWPAFLNTPTFFYKRQIVEEIYNNDNDLKIFEDTSSIFKIIEKGAIIEYMRVATVKYRIHDKAISRNTEMNNAREKESYHIYKRCRRQHLSLLNPIDLSVIYESWLRFKFKGVNGHKGTVILEKASLFYWYLRLYKAKEYIALILSKLNKSNIIKEEYEL